MNKANTLAVAIIALFAGASLSHAGLGDLAEMAKKQATDAAVKTVGDALKAGAEALYGDEDVEKEEDVQEVPQKQYQYQQQTSRSAQTVQQVYMLPDNFTTGERWGTWALNTVIPGLGSAVIMNDYVGMGIQIGLGAIGITSIVICNYYSMKMMTEHKNFEAAFENFRYATNAEEYRAVDSELKAVLAAHETAKNARNEFAIAGSVFLLGDIIFNIVRSYSYDKPTNDRHGSNEYGGFNLAVLPNRHGEFMPYLMYSKTF